MYMPTRTGFLIPCPNTERIQQKCFHSSAGGVFREYEAVSGVGIVARPSRPSAESGESHSIDDTVGRRD
jgi:hypothetical protein